MPKLKYGYVRKFKKINYFFLVLQIFNLTFDAGGVNRSAFILPAAFENLAAAEANVLNPSTAASKKRNSYQLN